MHWLTSLRFALDTRIGSLEDMMRSGLYMSDLSMHDTSLENVLFGLKPLHQLELARDQVTQSKMSHNDHIRD